MNKCFYRLLIVFICVIATPVFSQVAVTENKDHESMLLSADPKLVANKKLVYDFWREVFEGGHMDLAEKYIAENYIQHNPKVATGRQGFIDFFSKIKKPQPIAKRISAPLVSITAEGDMVILSFVREYKDPYDKTKTYTTTWFDMFRVENGKIAEHWDAMQKI